MKDLLAALGKENQRQIISCRPACHCLLPSASRAAPVMTPMSLSTTGGISASTTGSARGCSSELPAGTQDQPHGLGTPEGLGTKPCLPRARTSTHAPWIWPGSGLSEWESGHQWAFKPGTEGQPRRCDRSMQTQWGWQDSSSLLPGKDLKLSWSWGTPISSWPW